MNVQTEPVLSSCEVLNITPDYMKAFWIAARNCYFKGTLVELEGTYTIEKAYDLFRKIVRLKHESVLEHINLQIGISGAPRSFMAQITRHRHVTFHISSQHFQNHSDFCYVMPELKNELNEELFKTFMEHCNEMYKLLIENGEPHYIAREVLPNATACKIVMTVNLRELRHIIKLRQGPENTPNMQDIISKLIRAVDKQDGVLLFGIGD